MIVVSFNSQVHTKSIRLKPESAQKYPFHDIKPPHSKHKEKRSFFAAMSALTTQ
jgi:hypothetical protein